MQNHPLVERLEAVLCKHGYGVTEKVKITQRLIEMNRIVRKEISPEKLRIARKPNGINKNPTYRINEGYLFRSFLILLVLVLIPLSALGAISENTSVGQKDNDSSVPENGTWSRVNASDQIENTGLTLKNNKSDTVNTAFPGVGPYVFQATVEVYNVNSISNVVLTIDPNGLGIAVEWDPVLDSFSVLNDPKNYITLDKSASGASNNGVETWEVNFALVFSWNIPESSSYNCRIFSETLTGHTDQDLFQSVFQMENDLEFLGSLVVKNSDQRVLSQNNWVKAYEKLYWSGLKVVFAGSMETGEAIYPDLTDLKFKLEIENSQFFWLHPVVAAEELDMEVNSGSESMEKAVFSLNLSGQPPDVELVSKPSIALRIDTEPIEFSSYFPSPSESDFETTTVKCEVTILDKGGSGVDTTSIEYAISIHGPLNYGDWTKVNSGNIVLNGEVVTASAEPTFADGAENYIKWRASDNAGNGDKNGYYESTDVRVKIDITTTINYPPQIDLEIPKNGTVVKEDELITFSAMNTIDPDDDKLNFIWSSNISGELSTDSWFQIRLTPGIHEISITVDDGNGNTVHETVEIIVEPLDIANKPETEIKGGLVLRPGSVTAGSFTAILIATIYILGGTEIGKYKLLGFVIPLYSKLTKKMVLDHETRGMIRGYIIANPGDHFTSIKKQIGLKNGTLAYHLKILERENIIKSKRDGVFKRFYPTNVKISPEMIHMSKQEVILNSIIENPGISRKEMALQIGLSRQVINYHAKGLIQAGLVRSEKYGKKIQYYPNEPILAWENQ